ncbi:hypothetical protein E4L95_10385 [Paracoccus liaowanqingii]|uniref:Uncharacterized protein n=1 Tax=Paracoccus liaowanqingii TaxID=2560053 RepID=A0A4Z1CH99_9RHOB|nr:hypothetical protein [Paracoccus liaowanqingii]TGN60930.1 hypothetical protein E4L95_10385 [Paracoccus liaowanqingii]
MANSSSCISFRWHFHTTRRTERNPEPVEGKISLQIPAALRLIEHGRRFEVGQGGNVYVARLLGLDADLIDTLGPEQDQGVVVDSSGRLALLDGVRESGYTLDQFRLNNAARERDCHLLL